MSFCSLLLRFPHSSVKRSKLELREGQIKRFKYGILFFFLMPISDERLALIKSRQVALLTGFEPGERVGGLEGSPQRPYDFSNCPPTIEEGLATNYLGTPMREENFGFNLEGVSLLLDPEVDPIEEKPVMTMGERIEQVKGDYAAHERINFIRGRYAALHENDEKVSVKQSHKPQDTGGFLNNDFVFRGTPSLHDVRCVISGEGLRAIIVH